MQLDKYKKEKNVNIFLYKSYMGTSFQVIYTRVLEQVAGVE